MTNPERTDRLLYSFFVAALCVLMFVGGAIAMRYHFPAILGEAFEGGESWLKRNKVMKQRIVGEKNVSDAITKSKVLWDSSLAYNGYTVLAVHSAGNVYLVDMDGKVVYRWHVPFSKAWPHPKHVEPTPDAYISVTKAAVMPNGNLIVEYSTEASTPYGYGLAKFDKDGNVLWTYSEHTHHDFYLDRQNGNIYVLIQNMIHKPIAGLELLDYPMMIDGVAILSPDGKELKRIWLHDAFLGSPYSEMLFHRYKRHDWDHFHSNSVMKLEPDMAAAFPGLKEGQIMVSIRNFNALVVIDPDTQKVVWARNGPWDQQHSAEFLPNGHIMLLDNKGRSASNKLYSRILEFDPADMKITWNYSGGPDKTYFFTPGWGRVQRLPNGNTLVAASFNARVFEVTPQGKVVWDYVIPEIDKSNINLPRKGTKRREIKHEESEPPETADIGEGLDPDTDKFRPVSDFAGYIDSATRYAAEDVPFIKP